MGNSTGTAPVNAPREELPLALERLEKINYNSTTMCFWLQNMCPVLDCDSVVPTLTLKCTNTDEAGYCVTEMTGPGIGSGKYLAPVHKSLFKIAPCKDHRDTYLKEGVWKSKDGTLVDIPGLKPYTSVVIDPRAFPAALVGAILRANKDQTICPS